MRNQANSGRGNGTQVEYAPNRRSDSRALRLFCIAVTSAALFAGGTGCVEIAGLLGIDGVGSNPGDGGGGGGNGGGDGGDGGGDGGDASLAVRISASNVTPLVGEEVLLVCSLVSADDVGVSFSFEPANLLITDGVSSSASLITDASLVGQAISVNCRARANGEEGPPSDPVTITVTGP